MTEWEKVARVGVSGPLEVYAQGFRAELERLGYTPLSAIVHMRLMARLSWWLGEHGLEASTLTTATTEAFFAERRTAGYCNSRTARSVQPLVSYLQGLRAAPPTTPPASVSATQILLARYGEYLSTERGLAATTVALNVRLVEPFLLDRAKAREDRLDLNCLTVAEVNAFVAQQCRRWPRSAKRTVSALRSLLGFLHVEGTIDQPLAAAVPSPAGWTLAGLPKALDPAQVAVLLASCDRCTATGRRDLAILTLLARLGLRACEVAPLSLDDIDWRRGEIKVWGKGNRHDVLPLPDDVGSVVVDYLTDGRPQGALDRTVFVRAQAPYRAVTPAGVIEVVAIAGRRSGLGRVAAHRLRHSVATSTLGAGGSLAEIGQLLRHVRPATTAIYAKVDIEALRGIARPWSDGAP